MVHRAVGARDDPVRAERRDTYPHIAEEGTAAPRQPIMLLLDRPLGSVGRAQAADLGAVLWLQRTCGNAAIQQLMAPSPAATTGDREAVVQRQRRRRPPTFTEAEVRRLAGTSPNGAAAVALLDRHHVRMNLRRGGGTFYDAATNSMSIDTSMHVSEAALAMIHEASHAEDHHAGRDADATTVTREEYIRTQIDQEVEATVRENQARMQMQSAGENVRRARASVQDAYVSAYRAAVRRARRRDPGTSATDIDRIGVEAGRQAVRRQYMTGRVRTSTTNQTYPQYWGQAWDRANRGRRP